MRETKSLMLKCNKRGKDSIDRPWSDIFPEVVIKNVMMFNKYIRFIR